MFLTATSMGTTRWDLALEEAKKVQGLDFQPWEVTASIVLGNSSLAHDGGSGVDQEAELTTEGETTGKTAPVAKIVQRARFLKQPGKSVMVSFTARDNLVFEETAAMEDGKVVSGVGMRRVWEPLS